MTTETAPDSVIQAWSDDLEQELAETGMDQPQARAYRRAFELGLARLLTVVATKQELKDGLAELRDTLRRELEIRFDGVDTRFAGVDTRFAAIETRFAELNARMDRMERRMLWGFGVMVGLLITLLVRSFGG